MTSNRSRHLDPLVAAWLATFASDNTRAAYARDLGVYRSWLASRALPVDGATTSHLEAFRAECEAGGASASTVNRRVAAISSFYRHAGGRLRTADPTIGMSRRSVVAAVDAPLSARAAEEVWSAARALGPKTAVLIGLVLFNGWKAHELLAIDATAVRVTARGVRIGEGERLDTRTATAMRAHLGGRTNGPLLYGDNPTRERARLTRYGVDYLVKRVGVRAGTTEPLTVNVLRATYRSLQARGGGGAVS